MYSYFFRTKLASSQPSQPEINPDNLYEFIDIELYYIMYICVRVQLFHKYHKVYS